MDARSFRSGLGLASVLLLLCCTPAWAQLARRQQFAANSQNFLVFASSPEWAKQVSEMAELNRRNLAIYWLGKELPPWSERVPLHVEAGEHLGAGGETRFSLLGGDRIGQWMMIVSGTQERILDSVLPHEITHTIFATHFAPLGKYVPRWADEGACTTVEHISEKKKHQDHLRLFLQNRRGLAFNQMFALKEYPPDMMPLYAQGHSAVQFLLDQGGPQKFVKFLEDGMRSESWNQSLKQFYSYDSIGQFQTLWNKWLADGSPENLLAYAPGLQSAAGSIQLASNTVASTTQVTNLTPQARQTSTLDAQPAQATAPVSLATTGQLVAQSQLPPLGNESWYKRRLREVTGDEPPLAANQATTSSAQTGDAVSSTPLAMQRLQSVGRNPAPQSNSIQVLDWGHSAPVPGIQPNLRLTTPPSPNMAPIYR